MTFITQIVLLVTALLGAILALVRVVESIHELSKTPELSTYKKVIQVIKNFFTMEKYSTQTEGTATSGQ